MGFLTSVQHPRSITSENSLSRGFSFSRLCTNQWTPFISPWHSAPGSSNSGCQGPIPALKYIERPNGWLSCAEQIHNMRFGASPLNGNGTWLCGEDASSNERILVVVCRAIGKRASHDPDPHLRIFIFPPFLSFFCFYLFLHPIHNPYTLAWS
jgi:hypothetical protein